MAEKLPSFNKRGVIEVEDIRMFLADRTAEDNPLELDLSFSDDEIQYACRFSAMKFNEHPPFVMWVDPAALPFGNCFLNGVAYFLYLGKLQKLQRNDIDYTAGNMTVEINKRRIEHLKEWVGEFKEEFEKTTANIKHTINMEDAYRCFD